MNTEKLLPRHPFREGSSSTSRTEPRQARLRAIGLEEPELDAADSQPEAIEPSPEAELTDATLIDRFVTGGLDFSNHLNLKIEAINYTSYLTTWDGVTIASINLADEVPFALVKRESPYWRLVNQSLLKHHYMPLRQTWQQEFIRYEQQEMPDGYVMNFTQAGYLYQTWLARRSPLDLLLFTRNSWYPIRAITVDQGTLTLQTLVAESTAQSADWLVWLSAPEDQVILEAIAQTAILDEIPTLIPEPATDGEIAPAAVVPEPEPRGEPWLRLVEPGESALDLLPLEAEGSTGAEVIPLPLERVTPSAETPPVAVPDPTPQTVLSFQNGRLHIATAAGEVVVEGMDLRFWVCPYSS